MLVLFKIRHNLHLFLLVYIKVEVIALQELRKREKKEIKNKVLTYN